MGIEGSLRIIHYKDGVFLQGVENGDEIGGIGGKGFPNDFSIVHVLVNADEERKMICQLSVLNVNILQVNESILEGKEYHQYIETNTVRG